MNLNNSSKSARGKKKTIGVLCDPCLSPRIWICAILRKIRRREHYLVEATLQQRYLKKVSVHNSPNHAGNLQTRHSGDFEVGGLSYRVLAHPTRDHLRKFKDNAASNGMPVLIVPENKMADARFYARAEGLGNRVIIFSLENFITQSLIQMSSEMCNGPFGTMKSIIGKYNRRVQEIETGPSLKIDVQ